jgi:hypothetical protein
MEACVETSIPPPTSTSVSVSPAWAIRVARLAGDGFRMAEQLRDVPKPMLQRVFGHGLGRRIWELVRSTGTQPCVGPMSRVSDADLAIGMVEYLSQHAADTLLARGRLAKAIRLTITYADGKSSTARMPLAKQTSEGNELALATKALLHQFRACNVRSVDLRITSTEAASIPDQTPDLVYSTASA